MKKLFLVAILSTFAIFMACEQNVKDITPTNGSSLLKTEASSTEHDILVAKIMANEHFQEHIEVQFQSAYKYMKHLGSLTDDEFEVHKQNKKAYSNQLRALQKTRNIIFGLDFLTPDELADYEQKQKELQAQYSDLAAYFSAEETSDLISAHKICMFLIESIAELKDYEREYVSVLYTESAQNYRQLYVNQQMESSQDSICSAY